MPHGSIAVGDIEVTALCDDVRDGPWSLAEAFPDVPPEDWPEINAAHRAAAGPSDAWRAHDHCFLVRSPEALVLVDTGIGPSGTPVSGLLHPEGGALPRELEAVGVRTDEIDIVVMTHVHFDHIGWNVSGPDDDPMPTFAGARYLMQEDEWAAFVDDDDPRGGPARDRHVRWLRGAGVLDQVRGECEIADGVRVTPTPGHTAGSQGVAVSSGEERLVLAGDVANHPLQVAQPHRRSFADADPRTAAATRRTVFGRAEEADMLIATAHFPDPFGRVRNGAWEPVDAGIRPMTT